MKYFTARRMSTTRNPYLDPEPFTTSGAISDEVPSIEMDIPPTELDSDFLGNLPITKGAPPPLGVEGYQAPSSYHYSLGGTQSDQTLTDRNPFSSGSAGRRNDFNPSSDTSAYSTKEQYKSPMYSTAELDAYSAKSSAKSTADQAGSAAADTAKQAKYVAHTAVDKASSAASNTVDRANSAANTAADTASSAANTTADTASATAKDVQASANTAKDKANSVAINASNTVQATVTSTVDKIRAKAESVVTGLRHRANSLNAQLNQVDELPAVQSAKDAAQKQAGSLRKTLGRSPTVLEFEKKTGLDRLFLVVGTGLL